MSVDILATYVPMDRRQALVSERPLPDRTTASVLLADIAGFTPLTEALAASLGPRRGAEELTKLLNEVYTALVSRVHRYRGSVICFIGDALIGCFDDDTGLRALACGLEMQEAMVAFQEIQAPQGGTVSLAMKAAVAAGSVRRFLVGDPRIQLMDVLAGETVDRLTKVEHVAARGEVVASPEVYRSLGGRLRIDERRDAFAVVGGLEDAVAPNPWPALNDGDLSASALRPYLLQPVHDRVVGGQGEFLAELRPIVVLFLRFAGLDYDGDDDVEDQLDAFTVWVQWVVGRYGGHVLLLTTADKGSHLYAVFGALDAHEDDCERAVAAAVALQELPSELSFITGLQIGVSRGRARVGAYGGAARRTYGALGDAVNLAARLMGVAPEGEIRCSEVVQRSVAGRWRFDALPTVTLKGLSEPQPIYRPTGRLRDATKVRDGELIGRREELARIERSLQRAVSGSRSLLLIEGEAGIGKSRLVHELRGMTGAVDTTWLVGAGDSIERHTPYRAWRSIVFSLFNLEEEADPAEQRRGVRSQVLELDARYEERVPLLNDILGLGFPESDLTRSTDPALRQESLAALVGELLRETTEDRPLILVVEDAHWLDSLSWELALSAARTLADRPVLFALTYRPLETPVPPQVAALMRMRDVEELQLTSLAPEETMALAAAQLGLAPWAFPADVAALLIERAEGNPFYTGELVGALRDQGLLVVEDGICTSVGDPEALRAGVPGTLEGVVRSRLDRLPVEEQLTVKVASVVGRSFLQRTLREVYPQPIGDADLRRHLEDTSRRRLTLLEAEDPEPNHAFRHVVTQEVAYDTLLFGQRRDLHRGVADWYERSYAENLAPFVPLLVVHWSRAADAERECHYCRLAGQQAAAQHANAEAALYFTRGLELLERLQEDGGRRFRLLELRSKAYALLGRVEEERRDLTDLRAIAEVSGGIAMRGEVLLLWSDFHRRGGRFAEAEGAATEALTVMRDAGDAAGEARTLTSLGSALEAQGRFADARESAERALELFRRAEEPSGRAMSVKMLGIISGRLGEFAEALDRFEEARGLFHRLEDRKGEADIVGNLGVLSYYLGRYEESVTHTEQAERLFHEMGNRPGSAKCLANLGHYYSTLGDFARGLGYHRQALDLYEQLEDESGCADCYCNIGITHEALGVGGHPELVLRPLGETPQLLEALKQSARGLDLFEKIGNQRGVLVSHFNIGSTHVCIGDPKAAESHLQTALGGSREMSAKRLVARSLAALARASLLAGNPDEATILSMEAIELLGGEMPPEADEIHFTHARVLTVNGRVEEARPHLDLAHRSVMERAGTIGDEAIRASFLAPYRAILTAWEARGAAPSG